MKKKRMWVLIGLYLLFVLVKSLFSYFTSTPTMFNDEYIFAKMARSFFNSFNLYVGGSPISWGRPLYPILISISYLFKDMNYVYLAIKVINSLLSSLIIFPAYLLSKEFFSSKKAIMVAILISVLPMNFAFSSYIMSENIFYVLFLFAIYFTYKALNEQGFRWIILAGLFIGLSNLTRIQGLIFFPVVFILFLINKKFKSLIYILGISSIIIAPYYILNGLNFGFSFNGLLGYSGEAKSRLAFSLTSFLYWILIYTGYLVLASMVFPFLIKSDEKTKRLFQLLVLGGLFLMFMASYHTLSYERPIGRYIDAIIPGFLIFGLANLRGFRESSILRKVFVFLIVLVSLKLLDYSLFPVNHLMLSHLGVLNYAGSLWAGIFILATFFSYFLIKRVYIKKGVSLLIIFFITVSLLCYAINIYNADKNWYNLDQIQTGLWFNENGIFDKNVFIEKSEVSTLPREQPLLRAGFWINGNIRYGDITDMVESDYIISTNELDFKKVKEFGEIKIYENKSHMARK